MHAHHSPCVIGNQGKSVMDRMETGFAPIGHTKFHIIVMLPAQLPPIVLLLAGKH